MKAHTKKLISAAKAAQKKAYAPYSKFRVGAALLASNGKVFTGCNVENASYGISCCAERTALFKAISEGVKSFTAIAVVTDMSTPCFPCGICRQALYEFSPNLEVIAATLGGDYEIEGLHNLLPHAFTKKFKENR